MNRKSADRLLTIGATLTKSSRESFEVWRDVFLSVVQEPVAAAPLKAASLAEDLKTWTACLTTTVVRSCEQMGWHAAGKGHELANFPKAGQEYLGIDVMAFEPQKGSARWPLPIAVFELENQRSDTRIAYSLWKVLCVRANLRVVFAFRSDWESTRRTVESVCQDVIGGLSPTERMTLEGETILIVGNRGEGESFPWGYFKCWQLDYNVGRFEKV